MSPAVRQTLYRTNALPHQRNKEANLGYSPHCRDSRGVYAFKSGDFRRNAGPAVARSVKCNDMPSLYLTTVPFRWISMCPMLFFESTVTKLENTNRSSSERYIVCSSLQWDAWYKHPDCFAAGKNLQK